jgi:hypothetical protein
MKPGWLKDRAPECKHFNGIQHGCCLAGVAYNSVRDASQPGPYRWPCLTLSGKEATTTCAKREYPTEAELEAEEAECNRVMAALLVGRSACCDAELVEQVDERGSGPRFCSKCKKLAFIGCNPSEGG